MALTPEQQNQIEFAEASEASRRAYDKEMEQIRAANNQALAKAQADANLISVTKQARIEAVRLAKETLIENRRSKPVDAREVTAEEITAFADVLINHMNK